MLYRNLVTSHPPISCYTQRRKHSDPSRQRHHSSVYLVVSRLRMALSNIGDSNPSSATCMDRVRPSQTRCGAFRRYCSFAGCSGRPRYRLFVTRPRTRTRPRTGPGPVLVPVPDPSPDLSHRTFRPGPGPGPVPDRDPDPYPDPSCVRGGMPETPAESFQRPNWS